MSSPDMAGDRRKDDSVIAALGELKDLEADRRAAEVEAERTATAARQAAEREAQAARDRASEAAAREVIDAARREQLRIEGEARAERLLAIQVEAKARADAEARVTLERQTFELALERERIRRLRPGGLLAVTGGLAVIAIVLGGIVYQRGGDIDRMGTARRVVEERITTLENQLATAHEAGRDLQLEVSRLQDELARWPTACPKAASPTKKPPEKPGPIDKPRPPKGGDRIDFERCKGPLDCIDK